MPKAKRFISYLERLHFDPRLATGIVASWITNIRVVILLVISILLLGIVSYTNLPKRLNPEIQIPIVTVMTVLPGAGPEDIETLVTIPLENSLSNIVGIDTLSSVSQSNVSFVTIQFASQVTPDKAKSDVQSAVDSISGLPEDAQNPIVKALDFEDQPIWTFVLHTDEALPTLMRFAEELRDRIETIPNVDRVAVSGFEQQTLDVVVKPEKVQEYSLNPLVLSQSLKSSIGSYPAGIVSDARYGYALTIDPTVVSADDVRNTRLRIQNATVMLSDIADVVERSPANLPHTYYATSDTPARRAVTISVYKSSSSNIDESERVVKAEVDEAIKEHGDLFRYETILNTADEIREQYRELIGEFRSTILLVMACLFVFLGIRQALISSLTVPLTFLSAFVILNALGMSINFLTLFAFLISLGLLIDDTIVTVQAMTTYYKTGKFSPTETGLLVWRDLIVPIWSTTITTIWSFVPLLITSGIIGEFIKPIPIVVTATMVSSTGIAVLITLPFMIILLKPVIPKRVIMLLGVLLFLVVIILTGSAVGWGPLTLPVILAVKALTAVTFVTRHTLADRIRTIWRENRTIAKFAPRISYSFDHGIINLEHIGNAYSRLILRILASKSARRKVITAILIYAAWSFLLLPMGFVKNEFFPKTDGDRLYVTVELPSGTVANYTKEAVLPLFEQLRTTEGIEFSVLDVGKSAPSMGFSASGDTGNSALITLHLIPKNERTRSSIEIADTLRTTLSGQDVGTISVTEESSGPPAGSDLQIKLIGDDLGVLNQYADKIVEHLESEAGVSNVNKSIKPGPSKIVFVPDPDSLAQANLSIDAVGLWLRSFASGFTLTDLKLNDSDLEETDIVFRFGTSFETPETISSLAVPTANGYIPLSSLGSFVARSNPTSITRENEQRTLSVSAGVLPGYNISQKNQALEQFADELNLPQGYEWQTGGVNEENAKSVNSILQAMVIAFVLILVTMVIQFKSYRQAIIVLMVIPLAVSSVFVIFAITGTPLSFPALIGVLSLFGIVVTNSMFIVDKININIREGMAFKEAIADAGASRLEPIILTKLCTVFGLLPITLSNPLWRGLGGAIISGILLSSTIMLLFIPAVYYSWFHQDYDRKSRE